MKTIETLLNIAMNQTFATPKKLNRSSKSIHPEILEDLESGKFTFEMIEKLKTQFPIFHYKSCITIHGYWGNVQTTSTGQYKNIHKNQNGSLEVFYSAIDRDKIKRIREELYSVNCRKWYFLENSTDRVFRCSAPITKENAEQLKGEFLEQAARIKTLQIYGTINCYIRPRLWGGADIILDIRPLAIPENQVQNVCFMLSGIHSDNWLQIKLNVERERAIEDEAKHREREERNKIAAKAKQELQNKKEQDFLPKIEHLPKGTIQQGIVVTIKEVTRYSEPDTLIFSYSKIDGKGSFGRTKWSTATSTEFISDPCKLTWKDEKQLPISQIKGEGRLLR